MCLAPSHVKHKNDLFSMQDILYGVYTLSMPVLSLNDKTRFLSKSPQNFSNSRNVPLDFQFYPNLDSGTVGSVYNGG